ncbi:MAG: hypothetical protein K6F21_05365 [Bacteroidales bacterium]|nr:hypothetical protein [Bacteroidales bacterium]
MIGQLLLDHEEVGLPGLGAFMAEMVPASFSDKGYTINPPYRRVTFLPSRSEDDSLVTLYSESNGIDYDQSKAILQHFLEESKKELLEKKLVVFPGLGRLRSTRQNNFFFISDEDLDIFPDGFGLAAVSLKNHVETKEEVQSKVEELVSLVEGPVPVAAEEAMEPAEEIVSMEIPETPLVELAEETPIEEAPAPAEEASEPVAATEPKAKRERHFPKWLKVTLITLLVLAAVAAVLLATFVVLAQAAPDFIDSILYTPEELRIINYQ